MPGSASKGHWTRRLDPARPELVAAKAEREHGAADLDHARVAGDVERLHVVLVEAQDRSGLPEATTAHDALHDFVVRVRLAG